ncbi:hypothetical protein [Streptomyces sp. NPDC097981]
MPSRAAACLPALIADKGKAVSTACFLGSDLLGDMAPTSRVS